MRLPNFTATVLLFLISLLTVNAETPKTNSPIPIVTPAASDCITTNCSSAADTTYTLVGNHDGRPGTWGTTDTRIINFVFANVPYTYRVQILRVYGDNIAWIQGLDKGDTNAHAGVLFSMSATGGGTNSMSPGNANCFLYHEGAISGQTTLNMSFDNETKDGGLLNTDNVLQVKMALFLNDSGAAVFQDTTFVVVYRFVLVTY
jgi:hypothetical protein